VSKDVPCAFFSVEMTAEALTEAYLISETGVRFSDIRNGYMSDSQKENVKQAVKSFQSRDLIVDKCNSVEVSHIVNRMRVLHKTEGVEVVFVDYLQLLNASGVDNRQQEVGKVSRRLKQAAKNLDIALFTAAQLNRRVEHRETPQPKLSDLRDSGEIEQDADYVLLLWRPEYYGMQEIDGNPIQEGQARVLIAKQRMGETGAVNLTWVGNKMRFEDFHREPNSFGG
jgi:replicative DNA helicase